MRRFILTLLVFAAAAACACTHGARAGGGSYTFVGGTDAERAQVVAALNASSFDWNLLPQTITVNIGPFGTSYASYGAVFIDASLLDSGVFSWGVVQHE